MKPEDSEKKKTDIPEKGNLDSLLRETGGPSDGQASVPLWFVTFISVIVFWAGGYLFYYSGGFRGDVFDHGQITWGPVEGVEKIVDPIAKGEKLFVANCATCHQVTGLGQTGVYPPLAGSELVLSEGKYGENHLAKILLNGLIGPIEVLGVTYNDNMPAWRGLLNDKQIAYILTYIRQAWGNSARPIAEEGIAAMREQVGNRLQPWTYAELMGFSAEALPGAVEKNEEDLSRAKTQGHEEEKE